MMLSDAASEPARLTETQQVSHDAGRLLSRKLWLPKLLYNILPLFYMIAGVSAFFATLYISEWFWVLPHYLLFSVACLHLGILVYRRRHRRAEP